MSASLLFPGADALQDFLQKISDKIVAMVDEILTEKADAMMYEIIQPKIEECLKAIFTSSPVQLEAAKMFNREIFPIYNRSIDDFADINALVSDANGDMNSAFDEYTKSVIDASAAKNETGVADAKKKLMEKLKTINESKVGDLQKGGDLKKFILDKINNFKPLENETAITTFLNDKKAPAINAISEIIENTRKTYEKLRENMEASRLSNDELENSRISNMRVPGISACPNIKNMYKNEGTMKDDYYKESLAKLKTTAAENKKEFDEGKKAGPFDIDLSKTDANLGINSLLQKIAKGGKKQRTLKKKHQKKHQKKHRTKKH